MTERRTFVKQGSQLQHDCNVRPGHFRATPIRSTEVARLQPRRSCNHCFTSHRVSVDRNLVDARCARVGRRVDDVDATGLETRQDQPGSRLGRIRVAAGACIPAGVMNLVVHVRQLQTMNHLTVHQ